MFNSYYEKIGEKTICIDDELPFTIPSSWRWVRLNWIAKFASGKTPSMGNRNYYGNYIPWITSKDMKLKYIAESQIKLSSLGAEQMQIFDPQTLLLVTRSGILRHSIPIAILHNYATINQDLKAITLYYADLAEYIYLCIKGFEKFILTNYTKSGTTVESLVFERFQKILIPLPPEKEVRLITERCDTLIKHIDKLSANYVSLKENIEILKYRILDIFFGENCRYKSYYGKRTETTLEKLIPNEKIGDGDWVLSEDMNPNGDIQLLQLKHIGNMVYQNKSFCHIDENFFKEHNCSEIKENYLLINRLVASSMACCLMPQTNTKTITSVDVCWIAPDETYNSKYIMYYLSSKIFQNKVLMLCSGSTRKRISKKNLTRIPLFIHDRMQQDIIVNRIENLFELVEKVIG